MADLDHTHTDDLGQTLGLGPAATSPSRLKRWAPWLLLLLIAAAGALFWIQKEPAATLRYRTQPAQEGDLVITVTATGTLEPTNQVEVGSELSGIIRTVAVDYNDRVKGGQVLARLDTAKLQAQVVQGRAALASARARVEQARATVEETARQRDRLEKARELSDGKLTSRHDLDGAEAAWLRARADLTAAEAAVAESRASLTARETDLAKSVIYSPIDGIVLTRSVEPGQTVAASLQAPVLFTLAEDLAKMELHVGVDEADVGQVRAGQKATFTVDAYPDRTFPARIIQVRSGAQKVEGVVTYETVLEVDNSDLTLRPGMTATADIIVDTVTKGLLVPNGALRFTPPVKEEAAPRGNEGGSLLSKLFPRRPHRNSKRPAVAQRNDRQQRVWILRNNEPVAISVTTGPTDGMMTRIMAGKVTPGMELVVDTESSGR
ncbi:MAG: efflux RND transporter periplasmic adaptor subunit [Desulfobulbaceae bacterium]|nr:efflux RND transporter periplasmic adaptor subunit [Desulfobulbaceae bacterium]